MSSMDLSPMLVEDEFHLDDVTSPIDKPQGDWMMSMVDNVMATGREDAYVLASG